MSKTAALCWLLPEWAHVMMAVYIGWVPAAIAFEHYHQDYAWRRFKRAI